MKIAICLAAMGLVLSLAAGCGRGGRARTAGANVQLSGSGSTFVKPIMDKWIAEYIRAGGSDINYQGQGSAAGIKQMMEKAVDFGCTDVCMRNDQLAYAEKLGGPVLHIPLTMGAIAIAYNLAGVDAPLNFTGEILAAIYLGKLTKWNDERLRKINPGVALPDLDIAVVHRSDSSGSTGIFTEFLSKVSPEWASRVGTNTSVRWPCGVGETQTASVAGFISKNPGSIGYLELFYALQNKIPFGAVRNREGKFVLASLHGVREAAENSLQGIPSDLRFSLTNPPGADSYPISGTVWAVFYVHPDDGTGPALVKFFGWVVHQGQSNCEALKFTQLPDGLVGLIDAKLALVTRP